MTPKETTESATDDKIICLECGARLQQLAVHLGAKHHISVAEYLALHPGAPTVSKKASEAIRQAQRAKGRKNRGEAKPEPSPEPSPEPDALKEEIKAENVVATGPVASEWLRIGEANLPVWTGWSAESQAKVPDHDLHYQLDENILTQIAVGIELFENTLIWGPTGVGKTSQVYELASILNWPVTRINLNGDTRAADLIGDMKVFIDSETKQAITSWEDGPLVTAMRNGHIFLVDEIDAASPSVLFVMQRVTERHPDPAAAIKAGKPHCSLLLPTGEVVNAHPNFRLIATANTIGSGDMTGDFAGTNVLNKAFLSRWGIKVRVEYPTEMIWRTILMTKTGIDVTNANKIVQAALNVNRGKRDQQCRVSLSPRETLTWARLAVKFNSVARAAELSVLNGIDPMDPDRAFVADVIKNA